MGYPQKQQILRCAQDDKSWGEFSDSEFSGAGDFDAHLLIRFAGLVAGAGAGDPGRRGKDGALGNA